MSSEAIIQVRDLCKHYELHSRPADLLRRLLFSSEKKGEKFEALHELNFEVRRGEVLGIIGRNGAGKSTLLQLICGTVSPSRGDVSAKGRIAALLELGAGFNPEFSGRENIYLNAAILGLSRDEMASNEAHIIDFSGIKNFIDQPVKTYSSGMYVRLAFSVATCVSPDILVIDEALSVGDAEFSRKSFDRIMQMREQGTTILFCSHSLYQIEALCTQALWLNKGRIALIGAPNEVTSAYREDLTGSNSRPAGGDSIVFAGLEQSGPPQGPAWIQKLEFFVNDELASDVARLKSRVDSLSVRVFFGTNARGPVPAPSLAISFLDKAGNQIYGMGTVNDGVVSTLNEKGEGIIEAQFPQLALLKGRYWVQVVLSCERALHVYETVSAACELEITQDDLEQGVVHLAHVWRVCGRSAA